MELVARLSLASGSGLFPDTLEEGLQLGLLFLEARVLFLETRVLFLQRGASDLLGVNPSSIWVNPFWRRGFYSCRRTSSPCREGRGLYSALLT